MAPSQADASATDFKFKQLQTQIAAQEKVIKNQEVVSRKMQTQISDLIYELSESKNLAVAQEKDIQNCLRNIRPYNVSGGDKINFQLNSQITK